MTSSRTIKLLALSLLVLLAGVLNGCDDDSFTGPDFSTVPPPWNIAEADTTIDRASGLTIHVLEEGTKLLPPVTQRDRVSIRYTGRTQDGTVFASSYANGSTFPVTFNNLTPTSIGNTPPLIEGFREGLIGMYEGEKRILVIPPEIGYGDSRRGTNGFDLREDTLIYDVELVRILD
ncbi:MAG: FKBP-type peptidyl-prolyl cis-trans isomerase [Balneolaceae bacterium]|nr:FKBP-type peptidyl-prolyl cis-trans isomerase [Balneolaceae bacterium]